MSSINSHDIKLTRGRESIFVYLRQIIFTVDKNKSKLLFFIFLSRNVLNRDFLLSSSVIDGFLIFFHLRKYWTCWILYIAINGGRVTIKWRENYFFSSLNKVEREKKSFSDRTKIKFSRKNQKKEESGKRKKMLILFAPLIIC